MAGGRHTRGRSTGLGPGEHRPTNPDVGDPCDISFETVLNSVVPLALQSVSRGNKLKLIVDNNKPPPRLTATHDGVIVGVISHPKTLEVIGCIGQGNEYAAVVLERHEYLCKVKVERQSK